LASKKCSKNDYSKSHGTKIMFSEVSYKGQIQGCLRIISMDFHYINSHVFLNMVILTFTILEPEPEVGLEDVLSLKNQITFKDCMESIQFIENRDIATPVPAQKVLVDYLGVQPNKFNPPKDKLNKMAKGKLVWRKFVNQHQLKLNKGKY
jgi:hypothetical protein